MRQVSAAPGPIAITQSEYAVSDCADCVISTILGSCVSTCLWDPIRAIGGMNHILVANSSSANSPNDALGVNAMELLINALVQRGANRRSLNAKVFGGAKMISGLSDIGRANARFALDFLDREGIPCLGKSIGGVHARQVRFHPTNGRVLLKSVTSDVARVFDLPSYKVPVGNGVELF